MRKPKSLETKLRAAIRLIWSRSPERRAVIKAAVDPKTKYFSCPICHNPMPDWAGEVDHDPAIGPLVFDKETYLADRDNLSLWIYKMFFGPQRLICKTCHREKTKSDRKKMKKAAK